MKKQLMSLMAVWALAAGVSPLFAQSRQGFKAVVPFEFRVGNKTKPAGTYTVESTERDISLRSEDGIVRLRQLTNSVDSTDREAPPALIFRSYGSTTFLYRVRTQGRSVGHQLPQSKMEKELAAKLPAKEVSVALAGKPR